ncbi:hypothetical protein FACS189474_6140 [Bacteroidia bacterium]|nr:hypothetical protein FACS189474_6140 [Bacteroidia bacterium]
MGKFDLYKVDLKGMRQDVQTVEYLLDNQFFTNIGGEDIQKGKVNVLLTITRTGGVFNLAFSLNGVVVIPCDRCLDDMDYPIDTTSRLIVKFGKDYSEESDEIVVIPEAEGVINLAWFLYEFVALDIPIKHVHAPGKCNKQMSAKLKKHSAKLSDDEDDSFDMDEEADIVLTDEDTEEVIDPRWEALKGLKED